MSSANTAVDGLYQCASCSRKYRRADYLTRHIRTHLQSKPYRCHVCSKGFTRIDLLKRHMNNHESKGQNQSSGSAVVEVNVPSRVSQACRACAANHLRCSETKPCQRCLSRDTMCVWDDLVSTSARNALTPPPTTYRSEDASISPGSQHSDAGFPIIDVFDQAQIKETSTRMNPTIRGQTDNSTAHLKAYSPVFEFASSESHLLAPFSSFEFDFDANMGLGDLNLQFLDSYNTNAPFPTAYLDSATKGQSDREDSTGLSVQRICTDAIAASQWLFRPAANDHRAAEEENLSIPTTTSYRSQELLATTPRNTLELATVGRDRILTTVVKNCSTGNISKTAASFPSADLLGSLLKFCFSSSNSMVKSFIHAPTFDPNEKRPELVTILIAIGAVMTLDPTLTKLGFALQESVRASIQNLWEEKNIRVRDLQLSQCFFMIIEVGLWSGLARKVEIAEGLLQTIVTQLRRGGKLKNTTYPAPVVTNDLDGEELDNAWHEWIELESFRRLCLQVIQHDGNTSMCFLLNPVVSYAEIELPVCVSSGLWYAATSHEWKEIYLSQGGEIQTTIIADYFDDPGLLNMLQNDQDLRQICQVFLSSTWRLSWELIQLRSMQKRTPKKWNKLLLASRLDELLKIVQHFRLSASSRISHLPDIMMSLEGICLHLHAPIEDIQILAGIEGPQQSRGVYPHIQTWATEESARHAVWHAGQVLRFARLLNQQRLQGHLAMILYQAALVLWIYSLFSKKTQSSESEEAQVVLDATESIILQPFIQLECGIPCITMDEADTYIRLYDTDGVLKAVNCAMRANFGGDDRPFLVEKLLQSLVTLRSPSFKTHVLTS